ncbi:hypothetical protein Golomagni_04072 [Golovinomyces magnicellulatus]|nr:hypothetical protein Golomagni_04072 [Golovinomyces magnicellulatus]
MPRFGFFLLAALAFTSTVFSQKCRLQFDARVAKDSRPGDFDVKTSIFETDEVIGEGLKFSDVLRIPDVAPSIEI